MKPRYSGDKSKKFWRRVRKAIDRGLSLYAFACSLQELELRVLKAVKKAPKKARKK